jgi:hypothetical protein
MNEPERKIDLLAMTEDQKEAFAKGWAFCELVNDKTVGTSVSQRSIANSKLICDVASGDVTLMDNVRADIFILGGELNYRNNRDRAFEELKAQAQVIYDYFNLGFLRQRRPGT